jgi:hypothetical protein
LAAAMPLAEYAIDLVARQLQSGDRIGGHQLSRTSSAGRADEDRHGSAYLSIAAELLRCSKRPDVPIPDYAPQQTACLFDDLVGACEHRGRHVEADRLGRLQVDDQLELARPHDRQIAGLPTWR